MNKLNRAIICLPLFFFPMLSISTAAVLLQDKLLQKSEIDSAYRDDADDDQETQLKKERIRSAMVEIEFKRRRVMNGIVPISTLAECQKRLVAAMLDFHKDPEKIISILENNVAAAKQTEAERKLFQESGMGQPDEYAQATYFRADVELQLLRAKQKFKVVEGNNQPLPVPQLENAAEKPDPIRDEISNERDLPSRRALPELGDDNQRQAAEDNSIDEWIKGTFSPAPYKINRGDDVETRLKKQRINVALMEKDHFTKLMNEGVNRLDVAFESQKRLVEAQLDFHTEPKEIVSLLQQALESATQVEAMVRGQYQEGAQVNIQQVSQATYNRLDFEIRLLRAKKKYGLLDHSAEESKR